MKFWQVLEIDPTDNPSIVKKAYAKKLKVHHPEEDPEGYQKLREAYDSALKYIKDNKGQPAINSCIKDNYENTSTNSYIKEASDDIEVINKVDSFANTIETLPHISLFNEVNEKTLSFEETVEEFINKAQDLYDNFLLRINIENWITLLNSEAVWFMGDKQLLSNKMIEFLMDNHYLPKEVWKLLEDNFNWEGQKEYLYESYAEEFIDYLFKQIEDNNGLRYCYFKDIPDFEYDTFLEYREEAFEALYDNDLESAEKCINNAFNLYAEDPDLFIMRGRCYLNRGDLDKALEIFISLIQKDSEDLYSRFYRAEVFYAKGQIESAIDDCRYIEAHKFDNFEFKILFAKCYLKSKELAKAKEILLKLSADDAFRDEAKDLLKEVNLRLADKLRNELKKSIRNKELKYDLNKLYKELGRLDCKEIRKKSLMIILRRVIICLVILFVQVTSTHSTMKDIGIKEPTSFKSTLQFIMFNDKANIVKNSEDIKRLPSEISSVQGKLTNAGFLDLFRIPAKGKDGKETNLYLNYKEAKEKDLYGDMNGYICIGTLGDKKVIAIVDYDQATQAYDTKTIDFIGNIHYMKNDGLLSEVKKRCISNKFEQEFLTDIYIDTKIKVSSKRDNTIAFDALLLLVQAIAIFNGLVVISKLVKKNREIKVEAL